MEEEADMQVLLEKQKSEANGRKIEENKIKTDWT